MRDKLALLVGDVALTIATLVMVSVLYPEEMASVARRVPALVMFVLKEEVLTPGENGWMANGESTQNPGEAERPWAVASASGGFAAGTAVAPALAKPKATAQAAAESLGVVSLGLATAKSLEEFVAAYGVRSLGVRSESIATARASALTRLRCQGSRVDPLPEFYMKLTGELPLQILSDAWLSFAEGFDV